MIPKPRPNDPLREAGKVQYEWQAPRWDGEIGIDYPKTNWVAWALITLAFLSGVGFTLAGVAVFGLR